MTDDQKTMTALEGRMLAHRRVLAQVLAALPERDWQGVADWLADRHLLQDGQEDPGAVPTEGLGLEMAMADEFRELTALAQAQRDRGDGGS